MFDIDTTEFSEKYSALKCQGKNTGCHKRKVQNMKK